MEDRKLMSLRNLYPSLNFNDIKYKLASNYLFIYYDPFFSLVFSSSLLYVEKGGAIAS